MSIKILPKKTLLLSFVFFQLLCSPLVIHAQNKNYATGHIEDANKSSLPSATVALKNTPVKTFTDLQGNFMLPDVPAGKTTLIVSFVGYEPLETEVEFIEGSNKIGTITLIQQRTGLNEVLVTGTIAASQAKAYSIKRNSLAIMDVLAADAIGKLPDRNAAEAVQRIQGVAVARYHGEADVATVRGTPFAWTSTLFNGNRLPSASVYGNRASILDAVPSEMIQYVQVAKAITPDMEGDAIGGSINFITRTAPAKRILNVSAAGGYNTFSKDGTYNGSIVYGDRFFKDKLGVMIAAAIWDRQWGTDSYDVSYNTGLSNPVQQKSINSIMLKRYMGKRQTVGTNLGLEYKFSPSHKLYARALLDKFNDIRPVYESYVDYNNSRFQYNYRYSHYETTLNGFELGGENQLSSKIKVDWLLSDYLAKFKLNTPPTNTNKGLPIATFRQKITSGFEGLAPDGKKYWSFDSPDGAGDDPMNFNAGIKNKSEVMDPAKLTLQQLVIAKLDTKENDKVAAFNIKIAAATKLNVKAGFKYRHKDRSGNFGANTVYLPGAATGVAGSPELLTLGSLQRTGFPLRGGFFKEMGGQYNQYIVDPPTKEQLFELYDTATLRKNGFKDNSPASNAALNYNGTEKVIAGYFMAEWDVTEKLKMVGGLRNEYNILQLNSANVTTASTGTSITPVSVKNNYNALLPMLHVKYAVTGKANLRAAYTKTFVRANFTDLNPGETMDQSKNPVTVTKGNPLLKPTFSDNFDVMGEYFLKNIGLVSGGVFYKKIKDVVFSDRSVINEGGINYLVSQAKNIQNASLLGFEGGFNKRFDFLNGFWSGFGAEFNYTYIHSEVKVPRTSSTTGQMDKTTLPNQSKNIFNAILFYERNAVTIRLAGNYRGASVETINQQLGPDFYTWTDKNFTLDASASVTITPKIRVFAELNNLTNEKLRTYIGDKRRVAMTEWYGSRGQAGVRWDIIN
jgi:TonB-dependent receptor